MHNRDYAQVIAETGDTNVVAVEYIFGDDLLAQKRGSTLSNYQYDGLGSTRALTDSTGNVSDEYFYDAFGVELARAGTTENDYLFTGEQLDSSLGQYYLRARYYDSSVGRFTQQDTWMGRNSDPVTLHKYLYANADPVRYVDYSGNFSIGSVMSAVNITARLATIANTSYTVFKIASGEEELSASQIGSTLLFNALGGAAGKVIGFFGKKFASKFKALGCGKNSFIAGTIVQTDTGFKAIEDISIGDMVLTYSETSGRQEYQEVVHLIRGEKEYELVNLELSNGENIESTAKHLYFVDDNWVEAKNLKVGSKLTDSDFQNELTVVEITVVKRTTNVYNLTVNLNHNYYVGNVGVLVHNDNLFCTGKITAYFPKVKISGLVRNRPIKDLTGNQLSNAIKKSGYKLGGHLTDQGHAIGRLKERAGKIGFNTLGDIAQIINKGVKIDAGNGDVAFSYKGVEIIIDPVGLEIKTVRPAKKGR